MKEQTNAMFAVLHFLQPLNCVNKQRVDERDAKCLIVYLNGLAERAGVSAYAHKHMSSACCSSYRDPLINMQFG